MASWDHGLNRRYALTRVRRTFKPPVSSIAAQLALWAFQCRQARWAREVQVLWAAAAVPPARPGVDRPPGSPGVGRPPADRAAAVPLARPAPAHLLACREAARLRTTRRA